MQAAPPKLPFSRLLIYTSGMMGWSILSNILAVMLIYYYLPPANSGMVELVPQTTIWGIFNIISLIAAGGRLFDGITDPLVAYWSDRTNTRLGRRIPFLRAGVVPSFVFLVLIFTPITAAASGWNVAWLAVTNILFFLSITLYIVPYNALLPELARSPAEKVRMSTILSVGYVLGIVLSSSTPTLADFFQNTFGIVDRRIAMQWSIGSWSAFGFICMLLPAFFLEEKKYCTSQPATVPLKLALGQTLRNRNFLAFIAADFAFYFAVAIIATSLLYYVKVLLLLEEGIGVYVMGTMVGASLLFYPFMNRLDKRFGKKKLIVFGLVFLGFCFAGTWFLGRMPIAPTAQIFGFAIVTSLPVALLMILPTALLAELANHDAQQTGQQKEGLYFAVRNLSMKIGQTLGIALFSMLTLWGKDPGNDLGIRMNGVVGFGFCMLGAGLFLLFDEKDLRRRD